MDSGGEGLVTVLEGAYTALIGKEVKIDVEPAATPVKKPSMGADAGVVAEADIKFGYCTEFIIMLEKPVSYTHLDYIRVNLMGCQDKAEKCVVLTMLADLIREEQEWTKYDLLVSEFIYG